MTAEHTGNRVASKGKSVIGERLREAIAHKGMSLKAFSEASGVNYRTLQDYLAGDRMPGADALALMARQGIDVNWLLLGPDEMLKAFQADSRYPGERPPWLKSTQLAAEVLALAIDKTERLAGKLEAEDRKVTNEDRVEILGRYYSLYLIALQHYQIAGMSEDDLVEVVKRLQEMPEAPAEQAAPRGDK